MKKKILVLFILIILSGISFFYYSNKKIEGLWIRHYAIDLTHNNYRFSGQPLLEIKNRKLNYYTLGSNGIPRTATYFSYGKILRVLYDDEYPQTMTIKQFNKDSIVFGGSQESFNDVYKKIPDSLKNNSNWKQKLLGKAFEFRSLRYDQTDTIYFDDRYVMSINPRHPYRKWDSQGWELMKINGFDIMLTGNWTTFILKEKNKSICFYGFDNKNQLSGVELNQIEIDLTRVKKQLERLKQQYP